MPAACASEVEDLTVETSLEAKTLPDRRKNGVSVGLGV